MKIKTVGGDMEMVRKVNVKYLYFQVRRVADGIIQRDMYDLRRWIANVSDMDLSQREKDVDGIKGRVEDIAIKDDTYYALNFMRMDVYSATYKTKEGEAAEHVDIDVAAGEYIARNTVAMYDPDNSVIMIQSNRGSYGAAGIQGYVNAFFENDVCAFLPIHEKVNFFREGNEYTKLDVRLANLRDFHPTAGTSFEQIVDACNEVEGMTMHIEIGLGYNKENRLDRDEIQNAIKDIQKEENRHCVSGAKIKINSDGVSNIYDLLENVCNDYITCMVNIHGEITFEYMIQRMKEKYVDGQHPSRPRVAQAIIDEEDN